MRPPDGWHSAELTRAIAILTGIAWAIPALLGYSEVAAYWGGFIPARVSGLVHLQNAAPLVLTPLTATLVHGGLIHIAFNLLMLLFCGRSVETIIGSRQFAILYIVGAYASAALQYFVSPASSVPMIGASGAISAVLGVYAIMFGRNRVKVADPRLAVLLNALWLGVAWIGLQLLLGITFETAGNPVAIGAHIGGFLVGLLLAKPLLLLRYRNA